jgi:hypothetical protein
LGEWVLELLRSAPKPLLWLKTPKLLLLGKNLENSNTLTSGFVHHRVRQSQNSSRIAVSVHDCSCMVWECKIKYLTVASSILRIRANSHIISLIDSSSFIQKQFTLFAAQGHRSSPFPAWNLGHRLTAPLPQRLGRLHAVGPFSHSTEGRWLKHVETTSRPVPKKLSDKAISIVGIHPSSPTRRRGPKLDLRTSLQLVGKPSTNK